MLRACCGYLKNLPLKTGEDKSNEKGDPGSPLLGTTVGLSTATHGAELPVKWPSLSMWRTPPKAIDIIMVLAIGRINPRLNTRA